MWDAGVALDPPLEAPCPWGVVAVASFISTSAPPGEAGDGVDPSMLLELMDEGVLEDGVEPVIMAVPMPIPWYTNPVVRSVGLQTSQSPSSVSPSTGSKDRLKKSYDRLNLDLDLDFDLDLEGDLEDEEGEDGSRRMAVVDRK